MKLGIFTGSRAVDGKQMYKKPRCTGKVVLPCQGIAYLTFLVVPSFLVKKVENKSFPCTHKLGERTWQVW